LSLGRGSGVAMGGRRNPCVIGKRRRECCQVEKNQGAGLGKKFTREKGIRFRKCIPLSTDKHRHQGRGKGVNGEKTEEE